MSAAGPGARRFIRPALQVVLAHHPLCGDFEADVFRVGPLRFCRGCMVALPAFVVGAGVGVLGLRLGASLVLMGALGVTMGLPQLVTYGLRFGPGARAAVKAIGGIGLATLLLAILMAPYALVWRGLALALLAASFVVLQVVRARQVLATCRRCPWQMDWDHCPGLGGI